MKHHSTRAFSFIELLITLGIVGVIAAISAVSISAVRSNANDKSIKSNLAALQLRAELFFRESRQYSPLGGEQWDCVNGLWADVQVAQSLLQAEAASPRTFGDYGIHCRATTQRYAVWVQRPEGASSNYWCVDSQQNACGVNLGLQQIPSGSSCGECSVTE